MHRHTQYWFEPYSWDDFRKSFAAEITFNNETFVWAWDNYYRLDTTVNKLFILLNNEEKLAFDFNKLDGDTDTLYFDGHEKLWTYSGIQYWNIFNQQRMVRKITNNFSEGSRTWVLADKIGIYKFELTNFVGGFDVSEIVISAIIDNYVYNPINLNVTAYFPSKISRIQSSFSILVNITANYIGLVDSLSANVIAYKSDSLIYQNTFIGSINSEKIIISIPSQILLQTDSVGIRVRCTDKSIFNNEVFFPQTGYKFIPVEDEGDWNLFTPTIMGIRYMGMKFFSPDRGYIFARNDDIYDPTRYKNLTTDGGQSFNFSYANLYYWEINDIISLNQNTAYMITDPLLKTTDQGATWVIVLSGAESMSFIDEDSGWVSLKYEPKISRTYNGGLSWNTFNTNLQETFKLVAFAQVNEGYAVTASGKVYRSIDSGETWQFTNATIANQKKISMFKDGKGWLIGNGIWRTEDGGFSWTQQFSGNFVDAHFFNKDKGWVIGRKVNNVKVLLQTIDGGNNWNQVEVPATIGRYNNIDFVDESHGWIYAHHVNSGELLRTTNGGVTFVKDERLNNEQPTDFKLSQNYPNPFNPSTRISWQSPEGSWQTIKVFDVLGREVATLVDEYKEAGYHEVEFNSSGIRALASGIYFYQLKAGLYIETKKMVLLR